MDLIEEEIDTQMQSFVDIEDEKSEKSDLRMVPKGILKQFIDTYRAHPALWQVKNKELYTNRNLKNRGYLELVKMWKKFDPEANQKMVKSKIQSLRGSFRKELKKVEKSKRSGTGVDEIYKSTLWYFKYMMFLTDHELPSESIDNIDDPSPSTSIINSTQQISETVEDISDSESVKHSVEADTTQVRSPVPKKRRYQNIDHNNINPQKRQKISEERQKKMFMAQCTEALTTKVTETDALAQYLSLKIQNVSNPEQKMYAEALLTKVINKAILNKLTEATDLTEINMNLVQEPNYYTYHPPAASSSSSRSNTTHYTLTPLNSPDPLTVQYTQSTLQANSAPQGVNTSQEHSAPQEHNAFQESYDNNNGGPEIMLYADIQKQV